MRLFSAIFLVGLSAVAQTTQDSPRVQPGQLAGTVSAPPLTTAQKFQVRVKEQFAIRGVIGNAIGSAFSQWTDTPGSWGDGGEGYAKRFASGFTQTLTRQTTAFLIDEVTHADPRYFPSTESGFKARALNVVKQIYLAKRDDGSSGFAYGKVISAFVAGQVTNAWEPPSNNGVGSGIQRALITLGVDGAENLAQEIFPFARPRGLRHRH